MSRLLVLVGCVLLAVTVGQCQEQVTREIPIRYGSAVELAAMFGGEAIKAAPAAQPIEPFLERCLSTAAWAFPAQAWRWQTCLESGVGLDPVPFEYQASLGTLLPGTMAAPRVVLDRNALSVTGTDEDIDRFSEILDLLDKPAKSVALRVTFLKIPPEAVDALPGVDWQYPVDANRKRLEGFPFYARGRFPELLEKGAQNADTAIAAVVIANNRTSEVRLAEVLPHYAAGEGGGPPMPRNYLRALRLTLRPRINADNSVSLLWSSENIACMTGSGNAMSSAPPPAARTTNTLRTEYRVGPQETLLMAGLGTDTRPETEQYDRCGPNRLAYPIIAITPVITSPPAEVAQQ